MIDLPQKQFDEVIAILKSEIPGVEVRAFGSRVKGNAKKFSDLDLVIVGKDPIAYEKLNQIKNAFSESNLPIMVDVLDWADISDSMRENIAECFEPVQKV